jgi:hypothetical protein
MSMLDSRMAMLLPKSHFPGTLLVWGKEFDALEGAT